MLGGLQLLIKFENHYCRGLLRFNPYITARTHFNEPNKTVTDLLHAQLLFLVMSWKCWLDNKWLRAYSTSDTGLKTFHCTFRSNLTLNNWYLAEIWNEREADLKCLWCGRRKHVERPVAIDASEMFWFCKSSPLLQTCISASMQTGETLLGLVRES